MCFRVFSVLVPNTQKKEPKEGAKKYNKKSKESKK